MESERSPRDRGIGLWLLSVCVLLIAMILIGGATRLTGSGLSITEWKPVTGAIPPLSAAQWNDAFDKYRQTTQFRELNPDIGLGDFQILYLWEWGHRLLGRLIGLVVGGGVIYFALTKRLAGRLWPCVLLIALGGLQGLVGWWMVKSGYEGAGRVAVAPLRLALHLGLAFIILALAWRLALDALGFEAQPNAKTHKWAWIFTGALFAQILLGAIMAGSWAGRAYNDWPLIGGEVFPSTYATLKPFGENLLANHAAIQFNHRTAGYIVFALAALIAFRVVGREPGPARKAAHMLFGFAFIQVLLGIGAIVMGAPLSMNLIHQGGAIALWLCAHALIAATKRLR
jgi:cytochrome c oxidase assembly protein subunit 15